MESNTREPVDRKSKVTTTSVGAVGGAYSQLKHWFIEQVRDEGVRQNLNATILIGLAGFIGLAAGLVGWFVGVVDSTWEVRQQLQMEHYKQRQEIFAKVSNNIPRTSAALRQHSEFTIWLNSVYDADVSKRMDQRDSFARQYEDIVKARDELAKSLRENDNFVTSCQLIELRFADETTGDDGDRVATNKRLANTNAERARKCARIVRRRLDLMTELRGQKAESRVAFVRDLRADVEQLYGIIEDMHKADQSDVQASTSVADSPVRAWLDEVSEFLERRSPVDSIDGRQDLPAIAAAFKSEPDEQYRTRWKGAIADESDALLAANFRAADAAFYILVQAMSDDLAEQRRALDTQSRASSLAGVSWLMTGPWYVKLAKCALALVGTGLVFFSACLTIAWLIDTADDYKNERELENRRSREWMAELLARQGIRRPGRRGRVNTREEKTSNSVGAASGSATTEVKGFDTKGPESFGKELEV